MKTGIRFWDRDPPLLQVQQLVLSVAGRNILDGVDLSVAAGEIHGLLGGNGTGKTTLARAVMGCAGYKPCAGDIRFRGHSIRDLPIHERARLGITMAWQEPARFEGLTVGKYLSLGRRVDDPGRYLERVGLSPADYLGRVVDKSLSGGERKRVELASVLALKPALAILDEPASGIDLMSIGEISEVILQLREHGAAVLLITHREDMARLAERASCLCAGKIIFSGSPDAVAERFRAKPCTVRGGRTCP